MQVPAPFGYERATSVDHAIQLLEQLGPDARLVAGGHSFIPMMKLRLAQPEHVIDINPLAAELGTISIEGTDLVVGAMARHNDLLGSALVGEHFPILHDAERVIADPVVRNRGTIGGSLCQADPAEDLSAALSALHAVAVIRSSAGSRTVPVRELHTGPYETVVGDAEMLTHVRIPIRNGCGSAYEKVERRVGDWAIAAAAAVVWLDGGVIADAGIGLCAVGAEHFVSTGAEAVLRGATPSDDVIVAAAAAAAADANPTTDQRGPAEYKRHLAGELTARALRRAVARAQSLNQSGAL
jgi:carbon-monoxide dehydrogenase medium subunit